MSPKSLWLSFGRMRVCIHGHFNSKESYGWVECTLCGQWMHDKCMQVDAAKYSMNDDFPCGCDIIRNGHVYN
jgi:hypothetical protein